MHCLTTLTLRLVQEVHEYWYLYLIMTIRLFYFFIVQIELKINCLQFCLILFHAAYKVENELVIPDLQRGDLHSILTCQVKCYRIILFLNKFCDYSSTKRKGRGWCLFQWSFDIIIEFCKTIISLHTFYFSGGE